MDIEISLDPELDSGFEFDEDGRKDILGSPFFDVLFGADETADEYLDRILYRLSLALEEHITPRRWIIIGHPPPPPTPAIFPSPRILRATVLVVAKDDGQELHSPVQLQNLGQWELAGQTARKDS
ncbi:hypothetical protein M5K25_015912 [Dendrobium thyrsiflorum]|uniref:Uncharacterized protein n=1 Tax=Dendrobium thyrsiflorum TaxID=117978 RepID=A0ABD0URU4_DENTH